MALRGPAMKTMRLIALHEKRNMPTGLFAGVNLGGEHCVSTRWGPASFGNVHKWSIQVHPKCDRKRAHGNCTQTNSQALSVGSCENQARAKALRARTETEAIDRALDFAIAEHEKDRLALEATERFVKSGVQIADVYRTLGG